MQAIDLVYVAVIAILYYMFFSRCVSYTYDSDISECKYPKVSFKSSQDADSDSQSVSQREYSNCISNRDNDRKAIDTQKFRAMILIGVLTLLASGLIPTGLIGNAMSFASLLIILRSVLGEWYNMNEGSKLVILGIGLSVSMYGTHAYASGSNPMDLMRF